MKPSPQDAGPINSFAVVSYIPDALGEYLDKLREEVVCGCNPHAHVTVLTPRPLACDLLTCRKAIEQNLDGWVPFRVDIAGVEIFDHTNVIYAALGNGRTDIEDMHGALNSGTLWFDEPYPFHPHVTLAQGLDPQVVPDVFEAVSRRWKESAPAQSFLVEKLTFVQNTTANHWLDLAEYELQALAPAGDRRSHSR